MGSAPLIEIGRREVTAAAAEAARAAGVPTDTLFDRHERGDWGDAPDWLRADNVRAALVERYSHAIRSHYKLGPECELIAVTARDRTMTRLMLARDLAPREVSVREGYSVWAATYDYVNPLVAVEEPVVDALLATLPPASSAMDVGTGTGRLAIKLARQGVGEVVGVDATPEMLAVARETCRREGLRGVRFELGLLGESPLPAADGSVDLVTCGLMLCHLPDLRAAIAECARVVRPGGRLLLSDFHPATSTFGWRADFINSDAIYLLPTTANTRQDYLDAVTAAGCRILDVRDIALDGSPYGDATPAAVAARGVPPLCLVILAEKQPVL
jgi:ubiquinone/menaquinone biosynthesis C-methylase UbiE